MNAPNTASRPSAWVPAAEDHERDHDRDGEPVPLGARRPAQRRADDRTDEPGGHEYADQVRARQEQVTGVHPGGGHRRADRQQDPSDDVVHHDRAQGELADVAVQQAHLHQGLRDDRDRADAHRHAEEQHERLAAGSVAEQRRGQQQPDTDAQAERHDEAEQADPGRGEAAPAHQVQVEVGAGEPDQEQHPDRSHRVEHVELRGIAGQQPFPDAGCDLAEQGGAEQHAGEQLADDRGHAEPDREPAEENRQQQERAQLEKERQHLVRADRGHRGESQPVDHACGGCAR
jgi:hypothetical protein